MGFHRKSSLSAVINLLCIVPTDTWSQSLNDFKSTSWLTPLAYGYLLLSLLISIAVYAVDVFTAVNLLAFNRWSGEIEPIISIDISKWIFSACIIASFVNLAYEYVRALRVMRRGAVAESYLDSLAVRLECIRMGEKGRGWKRFLVFAELTKSKKGAEYVALFTYFSFQGNPPSPARTSPQVTDHGSLDSSHHLPRPTKGHQRPYPVVGLQGKPRSYIGVQRRPGLSRLL
jgi:hypothetical protein